MCRLGTHEDISHGMCVWLTLSQWRKMGVTTPQITRNSTFCGAINNTKINVSHNWHFVRGFHQWQMDFSYKGLIIQNAFPYHEVIKPWPGKPLVHKVERQEYEISTLVDMISTDRGHGMDLNPNCRTLAECSTIWITGTGPLLSHFLEYWLWRYKYFCLVRFMETGILKWMFICDIWN